jgi:hypothetical protein
MEQKALASLLMQLTEIHLCLYIQHYTRFKMMVTPFTSITLLSAEYFLAHRLIITCWNKQIQQNVSHTMTMCVYLQLITDCTDHIRHISRKWNLQTATSRAKWCNTVCNSLRSPRCVALLWKIQQVQNDVEMRPAIHVTQGSTVAHFLGMNCSFTTQIHTQRRNVDFQQTANIKGLAVTSYFLSTIQFTCCQKHDNCHGLHKQILVAQHSCKSRTHIHGRIRRFQQFTAIQLTALPVKVRRVKFTGVACATIGCTAEACHQCSWQFPSSNSTQKLCSFANY